MAWRNHVRRYAPLLLFVVLALIAVDTCERGPVESTIRVELGDDHAAVQTVRVELFGGDTTDAVAYFERHFEGDDVAPPVVEAVMVVPAGRYTAAVSVIVDDQVRELERRVELDEGRVVTVSSVAK